MTNIYGDGEGHTRDRFLGLLLIKVDGVPLQDEMANVDTERLLLLLRLLLSRKYLVLRRLAPLVL